MSNRSFEENERDIKENQLIRKRMGLVEDALVGVAIAFAVFLFLIGAIGLYTTFNIQNITLLPFGDYFLTSIVSVFFISVGIALLVLLIREYG